MNKILITPRSLTRDGHPTLEQLKDVGYEVIFSTPEKQEDAILAGSNSGQLSGFATDVYVKEPPEASPLFSHENVITTPHIGGFTVENVDNVTQMAVDNLLQVLKGKRK